MGQAEILDLLKSQPDRWFNSTEIMKATGHKPSLPLMRLRKMNFVEFKSINSKSGFPKRFVYKHKQD